MRIITLLLAGLLLVPAQAIAQNITIGTTDQYEAGEFTVDPAALQGFETALGDALCERAELSCEWLVMAPSDLLPALQAKQIDVLMAAIPMTAKLGANIDTTAAYLYPDPFQFVGLPGKQMHGNVKSVAAISDPAIDHWYATTGYTIEFFPTIEGALKAVENGEADIAVGELADVAPLMEASGGSLVVIQDNRRLRTGVTMALHADNIDLRFVFEDEIYDMTLDGSLNTLTEKWFGIDAIKW